MDRKLSLWETHKHRHVFRCCFTLERKIVKRYLQESQKFHIREYVLTCWNFALTEREVFYHHYIDSNIWTRISQSQYCQLSGLDNSLLWDAVPVHCRMFSRISVLYTLEASSTTPRHDKQKCIQIL